MSEKQHKAEHRSRPNSPEFRAFIAKGWADHGADLPSTTEAAQHAEARREAVSAAFPGERLVVPAGGLKVRSNDTDYVFRPHTAFAHLTGLGSDREPDAVLVLDPREDGGHDAVLYFRPLAGRDTEEFFADSRVGEFWVGRRPTLAGMAAELGIETRDLSELSDAVAKDAGAITVRVVGEADAAVAELVETARSQAAEHNVETAAEADVELSRFLSTLRLVKDEWEVGQMQEACDATADAFDAVVSELPEAVKRGRGERWVEGVFGLHARHSGNGVGYDSICASGDHATTLHWIRNTGEVRDGDLLLLDAGVEVDSLFTADVTRTVPVNGTFTDTQRTIYEAVLEAQEAGLAAAKPGNKFSDVHAAAIKVIATKLFEWGLLPDGVTVEATLDPEHGQQHRRWMVHGTSHHLGLDVHDCALALREDYLDAELLPGMVITVEPGLYFKADDLLVPEEFRGTGVRIEDDIVITEDGNRNLSVALPRTADEVEAWVQSGGQR
ncbi:aminopeptidase P family protein [Ornithinimicrobium faecis]|uniref:Xaa-Pro aminopeptidase n=1 Tax=Ornithinimicrobium faecis TaxID=2934158 RepID=A0ABY4YXF5_9MICO|nr:aminopeptidase P family protein [Ornithinimicrobium sp. HY1793]USQ81033.1 aminopeptidase P family protein [Ornithinimicrobium sp. HY1793]